MFCGMAAEELSIAIPRRRPAIGDVALLWLIPAGIYYSFLLTAGSAGMLAPVNHGLTFNSMLLHMLHGQLDVDPATIGDEGYLRDGAVYAYFGIFPALFRALFLWLPNFAAVDLTRIACLTAVTLMAAAKVVSVRLVWRYAGARGGSLLLAAMIAAILLGGAQIQFLRPSIFEEAELWAGMFAAIFVYLVLRGLCGEKGFSSRLLAGMALVAGLCLLTRVSNAFGLYGAFGLIWLCVVWRAVRAPQPLGGLVLPIAVLLVFVAITGVVNAGRWGNPLVFADFTRALINEQYPDRLARLQHYGAFNLERIGYGLSYYFAPFWVLRDAAGNFLWSGFEDGYSACCSELPPSSFLVSDPLLISLCVYGLVQALRRDVERRWLMVAAGAGLSVSILLMLTVFGTSYRYRMEFYPFFELFAFLGFARIAATSAGRAPRLVGAGAVASIVTAHLMWVLYMLSPFGPAGKLMGSLGIVDFYKSLFQ
jgi:hypothetical protein